MCQNVGQMQMFSTVLLVREALELGVHASHVFTLEVVVQRSTMWESWRWFARMHANFRHVFRALLDPSLHPTSVLPHHKFTWNSRASTAATSSTSAHVLPAAAVHAELRLLPLLATPDRRFNSDETNRVPIAVFLHQMRERIWCNKSETFFSHLLES